MIWVSRESGSLNRLFWVLHNTVSNFVDWPHSDAVMLYTGYVKARDGIIPVHCPMKKQLCACWCIQEESHCCKGYLSSAKN